MANYNYLFTRSDQAIAALQQAGADARFAILEFCISHRVDWALNWLLDEGLSRAEVDFVILRTVLLHKNASRSNWLLVELNERFEPRTFQIAERISKILQ